MIQEEFIDLLIGHIYIYIYSFISDNNDFKRKGEWDTKGAITDYRHRIISITFAFEYKY